MAQTYMIMQISVLRKVSMHGNYKCTCHDKSPSESQELGFTVLLAA